MYSNLSVFVEPNYWQPEVVNTNAKKCSLVTFYTL